MSFLSGLIDKARTMISKPKGATDAIEHRSFDAMIYRELLDDAPALGQLARDLNRKYSYTDDLVRDTLMRFFKDAPELRSRDAMDPSRAVNWTVAKALADLPETEEARRVTRHQKYGAAMATIGAGNTLRRFLEDHPEIEQAAQEAEKAQQGLEQANKGLQEAAGAAAGSDAALDAAMNGYDGDGPLTEAQGQAQASAQAAGLTLEQAIAAAEAASWAAGSAAEHVQQVADRTASQLQQPLRAALGEAAEKLDDENKLMTAWGVDDGQLANMSLEDRRKLARSLRGNKVSEFAQLLGRFKIHERSTRVRRTQYGRDELYATELSGRLPDVLPQEFMMARTHRVLRLDFLRRMSTGQLLSKAYRGIEHVGKGAVIVAVDTSDSMNRTDARGIPRAVFAKAFALAMLDRARHDKRDFVGIIFSSKNQVKVWRFQRGQAPIADVMAFVAEAFNGGTDFARPLDEAIAVLEDQHATEQLRNGDVLFITDDECRVTPEWMRSYQERKRQLGFRVFGVAVGSKQPGSTLAALSDNVRGVDDFFDPSSVADIMQAV